MNRVSLGSIRADIQAQPRAIIDTSLVGEYAEAMAAGAEFPSLVVFFDGQVHWLADGFHRFYAAQGCERREVQCDVREGGLREAILYSVGANAAHGLRRSNEDKRRAVQKLLDDAEWSEWSDREIARQCGVHQDMVGKLRPTDDASVGNRQIDRTVHRGGSTYTMNTASIGRRSPSSGQPTTPSRQVPEPSSWSPSDIQPASAACTTADASQEPTSAQQASYFAEGDISIFNDLVEIDQAMGRLSTPDVAIQKVARRVRHRFSAQRFEEFAEWFQLFADLWRETEAHDVAAE